MTMYKALARTLSGLALAAIAVGAHAQDTYPSKTIRIVNPYATGGSAGGIARLLAVKLSEAWGQPVIVEDKPGANQVIGTDYVAKAPPDGYTVLWQVAGHVINPHLIKTPYDAIKDFTPVATFASTEFMLVVHPSVPANTLREFIAYAKARPGQLNFAGTGNSGPSYLAGELFQSMTGVKMQHVGYKGVAPALTDLIGGQVQVAFQTPTAALPHVKSGKLKAIAVTGNSRLGAMPQLPTMTEAGLSGFDMTFWFGALMPAGVPKPIVEKFAAEMTRTLASPQVKETLAAQGLEPYPTTPAQFTALMDSDYAKYGKLIRDAGIKAE
ncbi:MAG TPA: tripartite tricarboxylate transporter substrate binding protein [Ramlibacter sp.]|nr:tripartite tricarboxylate transporter substrate binding protein [Ramlibacter sp.]